MPDERFPRFSFEITPEQQERANRLLDLHGARRAIFSILLDEVLDLIEEHGQIIIGILLQAAKSNRTREIIPSLRKASEVGEKYGS